jgi:hypothetical protein
MKRIRREDAIAVAEAIPYDPNCDGCLEMVNDEWVREPHRSDCAMAAAGRILASLENP